MKLPACTVIIPAYNRIPPLLATLASARAACARLGEQAEIVLVDDGSSPSLTEKLSAEALSEPVRTIRQVNQGSIVARMTGLAAARGEFVLFLDSDDLVEPEKLRAHLASLRAAHADVSYDDIGVLPSASGTVGTRSHLPLTENITELLLRLQPPPHGPVYRADFLRRALAAPILPRMRRCDSVGDIWLYYNLCTHPARVVKANGPYTLIGEHGEARYSQHWERLGFAALEIMETFLHQCPKTAETRCARRLVGECAFVSWRKLPRGFSPSFEQRLLAVWRAAPDHANMRLGGGFFKLLARMLGPIRAARFLRLRNAAYNRIRTIDTAELARLETTTPPTVQ